MLQCLPGPAGDPAAPAGDSSKLTGCSAREMSVVEVSASMLSTSSVVVMLSLRFPFFSPFRFLYWRVVTRTRHG